MHGQELVLDGERAHGATRVAFWDRYGERIFTCAAELTVVERPRCTNVASGLQLAGHFRLDTDGLDWRQGDTSKVQRTAFILRSSQHLGKQQVSLHMFFAGVLTKGFQTITRLVSRNVKFDAAPAGASPAIASPAVA